MQFFSADVGIFVEDGVVLWFEAGDGAGVAIVGSRCDVAAFVVENCQDEDGNGKAAAQCHPRHVDDVAQSEHDAIGDSAADVVAFLAAEEMAPRRSGREESDGEENAGEKDHANADAQYHSLDQRNG